MSRLSDLLRAGGRREPGPLPTYAPYHLILLILTVGDAGAVGRQALARSTGLGEGAVRTVLGRLRREGYVAVDSSGCSLTKKGRDVHSEIRRLIPRMVALKRSGLTVGEEQTALLVRGGMAKVSNGIEQRDEAIKAGASGATTYVIVDSKFQIPNGSRDCEADYPGPAWRLLRDELRPRDGDAVVICGSHDERLSMTGALSASLTLT